MGKAAALRSLGRLREERIVLKRFVSTFPRSVHAAAARERLTTQKKISKSGGPLSGVAGTWR